MRPAHYNTRYKHDLTPRQREVLELIARGRTNAEIGERLGLSLDGAKWHVGEILSKLNLDSREQAADYWRNYKRPMARLARTFAAISMPGALKVGLAGGAALGVAGIAVAAVIALRGGGEASSGNPPALKDCDLANVRLAPSAVAAGPDVQIAVLASASQACHLAGDVAVSVKDGSFTVPIDINPATLAVGRRIEPDGTVIAKGVWVNFCGDTQDAALVAQLKAVVGAVRLNATPRCRSFVEPSVLSLVVPEASLFLTTPSPGAEPTLSPVESRALLYARQAADLVIGNKLDALMADAVGQPHVCGPLNQREGEPACDGFVEGTEVTGYRITRHGSHGTLEGRAGFESEVRERVTPQLALASIGCATADRLCVRFIVAFQTEDPSVPAAVYLVFDQPLDGGMPARLIGMGISGDNADTILQGGVTTTGLGRTLFTPVK